MAEFPLIENTQFEPEDEYRPEPEPEPEPPAWTDGSLRIGIHTSIAGSYLNALESAKKLGCPPWFSQPERWFLPDLRPEKRRLLLGRSVIPCAEPSI